MAELGLKFRTMHPPPKSTFSPHITLLSGFGGRGGSIKMIVVAKEKVWGVFLFK